MNKVKHQPGDLVYAPQSSLLHTGGKTIQLGEPTLLLVLKDKEGVWADQSFCPVLYEGKRWFALRKDLYIPRRKHGDKISRGSEERK